MVTKKRLILFLVCLIIFALPLPTHAAPSGVAIDKRLPNDVVMRWWDLADMYPYAVDTITDIKAVYLPRAGWIVQFDATTVYINLGLTRCVKSAAWCSAGQINHSDALAMSFAQRVWKWLKREKPQLAWCFGNQAVFVKMLVETTR